MRSHEDLDGMYVIILDTYKRYGVYYVHYITDRGKTMKLTF